MEYVFGEKYTIKDKVLTFVGQNNSGGYRFIDDGNEIYVFTEDVLNNAFVSKWGENKRLYVLVNKHLSTVYGCVQGGHAVAQYLIDHPNQTWGNEYLIYLSADTKVWRDKLANMNAEFSEWHEPDMENMITAIACRDDSGTLFSELNTIR